MNPSPSALRALSTTREVIAFSVISEPATGPPADGSSRTREQSPTARLVRLGWIVGAVGVADADASRKLTTSVKLGQEALGQGVSHGLFHRTRGADAI